MSQFQQRTREWQPPLRKLVEHFFNNHVGMYSANTIAKKLKKSKNSIGVTMMRLDEEGVLFRKPCECGAGWLYGKRR